MVREESIGIFGGTFNPIHNGHLDLAFGIKSAFNLSRVIFVPSNVPPHKSSNSLISADNRMKLCKLACENYSEFEVSDIEIRREGVSYTYATLREFEKRYPSAKLFLLMGADMFLSLKEWKKYKEILQMACICTVPRKKDNKNKLENFAKSLKEDGGMIFVADVQCRDISSTFIRDNLSRLQNINDYMPAKVYQYILEKQLYK